MTSTYLYQSSAVENSMHAHIYLINMWHIYLIKKNIKFSDFLAGTWFDFFHIKLKNQKNIKFDKKKRTHYYDES